MFGSRAEQHGQCHFTVDAALLAISHAPRSETHFTAASFYLLRRRPLCISYPSPSEVQGGTKRLNSSGDCLPQLQGTVRDDLIPPYANKNSFVLNSLIVSLSFAAFSNSNRFAASRMSLSSLPI